jgi:tRNA A-37 threonylcarbamoyl transferase component Bud32
MDYMPVTDAFDHRELTRIIVNNHRVRQIVQQATNEFLSLKNDLLQQMQKKKFDERVEYKSKSLIDILQIQSLNKQLPVDKVQLALVGGNASGKTSLIHHLLESEPFLPSDVGPVSARIIRLKYADSIDACLYVYPSLKDQHKEPGVQISLSEYFAGSEPDWNGVKDSIKPHVQRPNPEEIEKTSKEFAEWAKYFVEIRIPSNFLKLGIDLYDTPGLLYSDPPVLKQNLYNLVKEIIPTLVFMYENPSVNNDTKDCFLALKEALGKQLDDTSIFFLNTKVDIGTIIPEDVNINDEEFENKILINVRQERKDLLLKAPGMAQQLSVDGDFNIISVDSQWDPRGIKMNQLTINHLIQFVANSDLKVAKKVSKLVLLVINSFFDFVFVTNHRTREQLQELRRNAYQWTENYFIKYKSGLDRILRKLYDIIDKELNDKMDSIIQRAVKHGTVKSMEKYIRTLIQHEIIKVIVKNFMDEYAKSSAIETFINSSLLKNANKNEFLVAVQQKFFSVLININDETSVLFYNIGPILKPLHAISDIIIESDGEDKPISTKKSPQWNELKKKLRQDIIRKTTRRNDMEILDVARQYLNDIRSGLMTQKNNLNQILGQWCEQEKDQLEETIDQQYQLAKKFLPQREKTYDLVMKYSEQFARIECKLILAQCLTTFNGHIPTMNQVPINEDRFFQFYSAEWLNKKDLIVKKLKEASDLQYLEAHYYRKLSKLGIPNILPLLYLYQNDDNELWMFFPKYECLEDKINKVTVENILKIVLAIAQCLETLHANELIHRNVNIKNIYMTDDGRYFLGDFYSQETYQTLLDCVNRHIMNKSIWISANDIYSFGEVGMILHESLKTDNETSEILDQLKVLFEKCLNEDSFSRPKASDIVYKLKYLLEKS